MTPNSTPASDLFANQPFDRVNRPSPFTGFSPLSDPTSPLTVAPYSASSASSVAIVPQSIVFIDTQIADYQQLAAGIDANAQVVLLNANADGITQISNFLASQTGISAIHIVSHGSSGSLQLGNSSLNHQTLSVYESSLRAWANALTDDADILLYGCEVAAGNLGQTFVDIFSQWTGADIAASHDLTGHASLGGDWSLEINTGEIAVNLAFSADAIAQYNYTFLDISDTQYANLRNGFNQLLDTFQAGIDVLVLGSSLPLVGDSLKDTATFFQDVKNQAAAAFTAIDAAVTGGAARTETLIRDALNTALTGLLPSGVVVEVSDPNQIEFIMPMSRGLQAGATPIDFDLGLPVLNFDLNGNVNAQTSYNTGFTFGIDLTDDQFYFDTSAIDELSIGVDVSTPGLNATGTLGFLQVNALDSAASPTGFTGAFAVDLRDPNSDGRLTATELAALGTNYSQIISPKLNADANINLVLTTSFGGSAVFPSLQTDFNVAWSFNPTDANLSGGLPTVAFNNVRLNLGSFFSDFVAPIAEQVKQVLDPIQPILDVLNTRMPVLSDIEFLRGEYDQNGDGKVSLVEFIGISTGNNAAVTFINAVSQFKDFIDAIPTGVGDVYIPLGNLRLNESPATDLRSLTNLDDLGLSNFDNLTSSLSGVDAATRDILEGFQSQVSNDRLSGGLAFPILQNPLTAFGLLLGRDVSLFTFDLPTLGVDFAVSQFFPILGPLGVRLAGDFAAQADFAFGYDTFGMRQFATALTDGDPATTADPLMLFDGFFVSDTDRADGTFGEDVPEIKLTASIQAFGELNVVVAAAGVGGGIFANVNFDLRNPSNPTNNPSLDGKVRLGELADEFAARGPLGIFRTSGKLEAGLSAYVRVGIDVPFVGFVGWEESFDIARVTLLDFDLDDADLAPSPVLAQFDSSLGAGVLRLNIGQFAAARLVGNTTDEDENFQVTLSEDGTKIRVTAFGFTQEFNASEVQKIYGEGGIGNDVINVSENIIIPVELWGDFKDPARTEFGDDKLSAGGAAAQLHGGGGNDQLTARAGNSLLVGGTGNDVLIAGTGNDTLDGGDGSDRLYGNAGNDQLDGGNDGDYLDAGDGNDTVNGGSGGDRIKGGAGNDLLNGNGETDIIEAGTGDDTVDGGAGNDFILDEGTIVVLTEGDPAPVPPGGPVLDNVTITPSPGVIVQVQLGAGGGNDRFLGGIGNDVIFGQAGNDTLLGQEGNDWVDGGGDQDSVVGDLATIDGSGNVVLLASPNGDDRLFGGAGNDFLFGQEGTDILSGGAGNDVLEGNQGNDVLFGENGQPVTLPGGAVRYESVALTATGDDTLQGGEGNDIQIGGAGNDRLFGEIGSDIALIGDNGAVTLNASGVFTRIETTGAVNGGNDTITGSDNPDVILGGTGSDSLSAGSGDVPDILLGDNGVVVWTADNALDITSTEPTNGGQDTITAGGGNDIIIGGSGGNDSAGVGGDRLLGEAGNDITAGDSAHVIRYADGSISLVETVSPGTPGGDDWIEDTQGRSTVLGGSGNDTITTGDQTDLIIGDNGEMRFSGNQLLQLRSQDATATGDDHITAGNGADSVIGGTGSDSIAGGIDDAVDILLGDNGIVYGEIHPTFANEIESTDPTQGGQDTVTGGGGNDFIIGGSGGNDATGVGGDRLFGESGDDIILGDSGRITRNAASGVESIETLFPTQGGDDLIDDTDGTTIALGGTGNDTITTGNGADLIVGDNGEATFFNGQLQRLRTKEAANGGNDRITAGNGADIVLAGTGDDEILGGNDAAEDILLGDNGVVVRADGSAQANDIFSTDPTFGGNDRILGGAGNDIIIGGTGGDTQGGGLWGEDGDDVIVGDNGYITRNAADVVERVATLFPEQGGHDAIQGGNGADTALGGTGNDTIAGGDDAAEDILLGDNGVVVRADGSPQANDIFSTDPTWGGRDRITGGGGDDIIIGGSGGEDATGIGGDGLLGNAGDDLVMGDGAYITRDIDNQIATITSLFPEIGGDDSLQGDDGNDTLIGGFGNDVIDGNADDDIAFGDHGLIDYTVDGDLTTIDIIAATYPDLGGNDTITGGEGNDTAIGGAANDSITGNTGADVALGDNGQILFMDGVIRRIETLAPEVGGNDTIAGNEGNDRALGGSGNDSINGNADDDILLGDNGFLDYGEDANLATLDRIATTDPTFGGNDTITGDAGNDTILGGAANDLIAGGTGNDVALGDNGRVLLTGGVVRLIETTDPSLGGNDTVNGDADDDILLGGAAHDRISGNTGNDILLGDNGQLNYGVDANLATLDLITSTDPAIGGNDTISGDDGSDIAFGGVANDTITGGAGEDKLLGDNGQVILLNGLPDLIQTIAPGIGGNDDISGNAEDDVIAGGFADDILNGDNGDDRILGDNGNFDYTYAGDSQVGADTNPFTLDFFTTTDPTLGGNDLIVAGLGNDTALGGTGSDQIYGDQGVDTTDPTWQIVATGDFNHDGFSDLIWRNSVTGRNFIWMMEGDRVLAARPLQDVTDLNWHIVGTGDFNGDGETDILWRHQQTGANGVWFLNGIGFQSAGSLMPQVDLGWNIAGTGDFNGDKKVDILWRHQQSGANGVWAMDGTNFMQALGIAPVSDLTWKVAGVRDFNADGKVDILWRNQQSGANGIWLMDQNNFLAAQGVLAIGDLSWSIGGVGDVNGDSKTDIVWRNQSTGTIGLWHMDGNTLLGTAALPPAVNAAYQVTNTNWTIAGRADFNHDGQTDLLWQNPLTGQVAIWLMSGTTLKQEILLPQVVGGQWTIVGTGDFNHDGDIDIVWRDYQSGSNGIWFMDDTTLLSAVALAPQTDVAWKIVGVADINQDNQLDLIWRHDQLGSNGIWLMKNASEILGFGGIAPVTDTAWKIVGIADVNGDTHADLFWRNEQSGANGIWLMQGNQMLSVAGLLPITDPNWKLEEIGDFNSDGKLDLVWRNYATGITAAWLMNGNNLLQTTVIQNGNSNNDVLLGDHGKVYSALPLWQNVFSIDTGAGQGGAGDILFGNQGDDLMMGQQGGDAMFGETGEDDMLGGHNVAGGDDGSDIMDGGAAADVMLGDNGVILRRPLGYQLWQRYPAPFANVIRDVTRYDDRDWIGGNDTMFGGTEDDVMHGQRGDDWMYGNAGDDEMYGELGNDNMSGGAGVDTMLGDVGIITHAYNPDGTPRINQNGSWHRDVILTDVGEITASVSAATPSVEMFQTADVLLATGTTNPDGSQRTDLQVISLFNDGYDAMSGDDGDDAMFGQRGNDTMHGGAGNDYMQGNAGDDQVNGDEGNDLVIGDDSNNLAAFNTEIPNVTRGLHLITRSAGVNINLGLDGVVVMPAVNLTPKMTYGLLPTLTLAPQQSRDNSPVPVIGNLQAGDGSVLQPLVAIVPNLVNHLDQLSGQDTVNGGTGADLVVGDDFSNVMPLRTGNPGIDPVLDQLTRQLYQLIYDVHDLELASMNAAPQTLTVMIGNDVVDGGDDNDSVFGDNHLFFGPFVRQMPNSTGDLWSLLTGLQSAIATVSYGVNQLIPGSSLWPKPFSLSLGNDVVRGGHGEDFLYADDNMTIAPILNTLNYQHGSFWSYNLAGANRPARANFRDYDLQLGNDDMSGGGGHDLMVGGYSTIINPLVTVPVAPTDINLQRSLELLISDINTFVRDLHTDNHGILYDTRNQSHTLIAQNDVMRGDSGNDLLVADNTTLTAPFLNGQINTSIPLSRDYLDYSEEEHNFMHGLQHQYDLAYRRANLGFTRMAEDGLFGGDGNDILLGLRAIDIMFGDLGDDFLAGGDDADQITEAGSGNIIRNTNPSPADRRDIINPAAQLMLTNLLSPVMQQYIQQILQAQNNLVLEGQFYANFPG